MTEKKEAQSGATVETQNARSLLHTPGPWSAVAVDTDGQYTEWEVHTIPPPVLSGIPPVARIGYVTEQGAADARLISAAPELLAMCKLILAEWESDVHSTQCFDSRIITNTRLAIAKAEGASPLPNTSESATTSS